MDSRWYIVKKYFDWVPESFPYSSRDDGDFTLVIPNLHPEMICLNRATFFIFNQCDGKATVFDILCRYMVKFLRADREEAAWEVIKVLRQLDLRLAIDFCPSDTLLAGSK